MTENTETEATADLATQNADPHTTPDAEPETDGEIAAEPADSFDDWQLLPEIRSALTDMGYSAPMEVQSAVFEHVTKSRDLMVESKTGTGKTAGFGIPIMQMLGNQPEPGVQALVLAPTRELALQVANELKRISVDLATAVVPIYGGAPMKPQINALEDGAQVVVGTPGRVLDHIHRKTLKTNRIKMLVLDECDEMLSMGFQEEIENILSTLPPVDQRQTLLFSATIPEEIERIGKRHMREPEKISLSTDGISVDLIDHYYYVVSGMARTRDLLRVILTENPESAIIFCNTREETNTVARYLSRHGCDAEAISSDLTQRDRERVMKRTRDRNLRFLVATDIAARGIDISDLSHVINYTFPESPEIYVHRTGRTGRAGKTGVAISLVGPHDIGSFYYLKLIYKIVPTERDLPKVDIDNLRTTQILERVQSLVTETPRRESIELAKQVWSSPEGERIFGALIERLLRQPREDSAPQDESDGTEEVRETRGRYDRGSQRRDRGDRGDRDRKRRRERRGDGDRYESRDDRDSRRRRRRRDERPEGADEERAPASASGDRETPRDTEAAVPPADSERSEVASTQMADRDTSTAEMTTADTPAADSIERAQQDNGEQDPDGQRRKRRRRRRERGREERGARSEDNRERAADSDRKDSRSPSASRPAGPDGGESAETAAAPTAKPARQRSKGQGRGNSRSSSEAPIEFWETWADEKTDSGVDDSDDDEAPVERAGRSRSSQERTERSQSPQRKPGSTRLYVNVGKRENITADDVRALLSEALGDDADQIGSVSLRNTHCYVRVPDGLVDRVIEETRGKQVGDREIVVERARR